MLTRQKNHAYLVNNMNPSKIIELEDFVNEQQRLHDEKERLARKQYLIRRPNYIKERYESQKKRMAEDSEYAEKIKDQHRKYYRKQMLDPEKREKRRQNCRRHSQRQYRKDLQDPEAMERRRAKNRIDVANYRERNKNK